MNAPRRPPLPPSFLLAVGGGVIGTALLVLAAMIAFDALAPPLALLGNTAVQVVMIAIGLVLVGIEVRAVLALARSRQDRSTD